jgi:hypothetical protein
MESAKVQVQIKGFVWLVMDKMGKEFNNKSIMLLEIEGGPRK